MFLKLDVQGFEMHVLRGAERALAELRGVQAELALDASVRGRLAVEAGGRPRSVSIGFELAGVEPGFADPDSGRMLQFDGVFLRA